MPQITEEWILVFDRQRKCLYLTLSKLFKNSEGLEVVDKFPNELRAIEALKKYSKQKVFGRLNLKDAIGDLADHCQNDGVYAKPLEKETSFYDDAKSYLDSAKGQMINRLRAEQELENHGIHPDTPEWEEFEKVFGQKLKLGKIKAQDLLQWLGH